MRISCFLHKRVPPAATPPHVSHVRVSFSKCVCVCVKKKKGEK